MLKVNKIKYNRTLSTTKSLGNRLIAKTFSFIQIDATAIMQRQHLRKAHIKTKHTLYVSLSILNLRK